MAEEASYHDGDIVWVKMNKLWWPGEVHGAHRLPSDFFDQFKKPPLVIVKFFQENNYHYVNQLHQIARFNCAKKNEFIKKGLDLYYAKHSYMEVFPADVAIAEKRTGGNPNIIYSKEFMPVVKADKSMPLSASKGTTSRSRRGQEIQSNTPSIPRVMIKPDHDTRILVPSVPVASTSLATPTAADNKYKCNLCNFSTNRINTFVWHQKTHNSPKTPQVSATQKFPINRTPSTSLVNPPETSTSSTSVKLGCEEENNVSGIDELTTSTPVDKITEPAEEVSESVDKEIESADKVAEPIVLPEKTKGKRARKTNETPPKSPEKAPKTDNKLRKILDDWSDDEFGEAGPSGSTSNKNVNCSALDTDDDDDINPEFSVKKKLKFDNDTTCNSNGTEEKKSEESGELAPSVVEDEIENKPKSVNNKEIIIQANVQLETKDVTNDEAKPQTRFSLRSGRATQTNENSTLSPITPKRRGRAKRNANDSLKCEAVPEEIKESEIEPILPEKSETIENSTVSSGDKVSDESVRPASVPAKSNSKTSRKGSKPRRKEEIKLANNISVAVLVEKTNPCPSTDKESEQKPDIPSEGDEFPDIVHKKVRYVSHSPTDDLQNPIEVTKLPEPDIECNNHSDEQMIVEPANQEEQDAEIVKDTVRSIDQNEEINATENTPSDVFDVSMSEPSTSVLILDSSELTEKVCENSTVTGSPPSDEQPATQRCYKRKSTPRMNVSSDQLDASTSSSTSITDDLSIDKYESPSSSNLRQRAPKRYENTRNRRKSDRRTTSEDDIAAIVKEIDVNCEKNDRARQKSVDVDVQSNTSKLSDTLNDSGKEAADSTNTFDQFSENSNSKTSTPEKADNSKELDCFDFTEDECLKLPPSVLNLRKRLPPGKVFELEDIDKIEEQRKIDEETARVAQQREEENQKLHAELENLLNSTTPVALPEIPVGPKVQENFPERRAEKDPEKLPANESDNKDLMLPPAKERNKRIFKYRNRNRGPDSDANVANASCDSSDNKGNNSVQQAVRLSVDEMEVEPESETDKDEIVPARDLKLEIAETLINFPLLSPQTNVNVQSIAKVVTKPLNKRKESVKSTRTIKKLRSAATVETLPDVCRQETIITNESTELLANTTKDPSPPHTNQQPTANIPPNPDNLELQCTKTTVTDTVAANRTSVRDFSRIRLIEKIDSHTTTQPIDEKDSSKTHQLPSNQTVIFTPTEGNSFVARIPKKRKSQHDDDIPPAFVIERPKDHPDDPSESNNKRSLVRKEPKSFVVTKTVKKQITGDVLKHNTLIAGSEVSEGNVNDSQQEMNTVPINTQLVNTITSVKTIITQVPAASEVSSIAAPVITTSHLVVNKSTSTKNAPKRTASTSTAVASNSNVLGSLSANRPCIIAPAAPVKKASYRRPTDMTGVQQKQIGIDGNGNPVMIYTKISPTVTQSPPVISQVTFPMRNEPIPSTSQLVQSYSTSVQSNQGNQFVITSKGALITSKPFITTTHSTQFNQPTLTNRSSNIQIHTQLIRSPNSSQAFQQHPSPSQSNQIIIQTKPSSLLTPISSTASVKKQPPNRRTVVNKAKAQEQSNDRLTNLQGVTGDNGTAKKRVVRRVSKNQSSATATATQQMQVVVNSEINHIGNAVPPLIPLSDTIASRKQPAKQQSSTQMTFIQEPQVQSKTTHVDVVEQQHQENTQEILALPGDTPGFGGPAGSYFLCKMNEMGIYVPIDHQPLYLDVTDNTNLLKPNAPDETMITEAVTEIETEIPQQSQSLFGLNNDTERVIATNQSILADQDANNPKYLINISDGQQLLVDQQSLMALANGEEFPQFVTSDGHQIILQHGQHDILSAIAFAEDVGLIAGQQILIPEDDLAVIQGQGGNHDILAAALAGTEAFSQEQFIDNVLIRSANGVDDPMVYHTMPRPTITPLTNAVTNATNAVSPIMSTLEHPTKTDRISPNHSLEFTSHNLDESLAVIGVTSSNTNVPTSLELPITITNPAIASKTTSMSTIYPPTVTADDLDYDIFSSSLPITHHHLTQSLDNYRTVNVINSIGGIEHAVHQFIERN